MNNILTCTDGSVYATSIYKHAAWAACRADAAVHVIHMLDPHTDHSDKANFSGNLEPGAGGDMLAEFVAFEQTKNRLARERGKQILEDARRTLKEDGVGSVTVEQQHGRLVDALGKLERDVDLLIMGKRGESADFAKLHLGSSLERVIRASKRPMLVASREFKPIERFLIAYDGGPSIEKAIQFAMDRPLLRGLHCHLLRAGKIDDNAKWFLEEAAEKLRKAGYEVTVDAIAGEPEKVIAEAVVKKDINLLVMGAYGHSRIRHLIIGSTTTEMVRDCRVPVLMFR